MPRRSRSLSLSAPRYLPYEAQHVMLNTVQRMLEESCFEFAKKWFTSDPRVREWTTPAQVEISKWRDLLGTARIPAEALDGHVQTPLRVLLQEATQLRNNAVHRSQVHVQDLLKLLTSSIQLTRMLRDQTRRTKIEDIRSRLVYELDLRDDNRARATVEYRKARDDIDKKKEPMFKKLDELYGEEDHAITVFEKDSALCDNMLQSSMVKFINQVIHTGEEVARIAPTKVSTQKPQPIVKNSNVATDGKSEATQEKGDEDVQFISKSDFEEATLGSRKMEKKPTRDVRSGPEEQKVFFKEDHAEDLLSSIYPAVNFVEVQSTLGILSTPGIQSTPRIRSTPRIQSTPGIRSTLGVRSTPRAQPTPVSHKGEGSSRDAECTVGLSSHGATPRALSVANSHCGTELDIDSPSRQLELEANMANSIGELSIDGHDILETLDAELDSQLLRTMSEARMSVDSVLDRMNSDVKPSVEESVPNSMECGNSDGEDDAQSCRSWAEPCVLGRRAPSSELKMTDRSFAPSPDVEMSGANAANFAAADATTPDATTADSATPNVSTSFRKEEIPQTPVGLPVVEFGKPWKPTSNGPASIIGTGKSQEGISQIEAAFPSRYLVSMVGTEKSKQVNLNNIHLWRKRKAASPLNERTSASCNSMISARPHGLPAKPNFLPDVAFNATGSQPTASVAGLPMMISFGDVARFANTMGPNLTPSAFLTGVGPTGASQTKKPQETMGSDHTLFTAAGSTGAWQLGKPQDVPAADVVESRQAATWEGRRILVGCLSFTPSKAEVEKLFSGYNVTRVDFPEMWMMETENRPAGGVFVDLATAAQARLAIQKLAGEEPKIRNCRVSIILATDPWKLPPKTRVHMSNKKRKKTVRLPVVAQPVKKSQPIGKRTRSYYAELRKNFQDGQS